MKILGHASYVGNTGYNAHSKGFFRALSKKTQTKIRNFTIGPNWSGYIDKHNDPHHQDVTELDRSILISQSLFDADRNLQDFPLYNHDESYIPDINIILNSVNHYYFYQNYKGPKIGYVVWENTLYPEDFFAKLLEYDQVWVPTEWQAKITIDQGVPPHKVKIVREAVNPEIYNTSVVAHQNDVFTFVMFGAWGDRKSTKEIIQSFINVFGNNNKVQLILSVANSFNGDGFKNTEERLSKHNLYAPNIKVVDFVSNDEYRKYMRTAHVFLSCARGEGWNIPLIEAMACGTPSIYSNCSGQLEFAKDLGIPVNIKGLVLAKNFEDNKNQDSPGYWYEPDFNDLEKKILEVYNNYSFYKEKAITESKYIRETFTWENAADAAMLHLKDLFRDKVQLEVSCSFVGTGGLNSFCQELLPELNNSCKVKVRNFTIGKNWNGYNQTPHDLDIKDYHKNILHKQTLFNSDGSRSDYPIYNSESDFIPNVNLVMDGINHHYFYDNYIGPKIAYTMYETTKFPEDFLNQLRTFDQLWVPSTWQKENLIKQNFAEQKLRVVPLGVDGDTFFPISDKFQKFTFVLVGRWDARKSTMEIIRSFKECFENNKNVELLLLVDNPFDIDGLGSTKNRLKHYNLESENIKALSFTTREEYVSLLQRSHVFLSCSRAEGWNLPLIESMACGTVSIYSDCSAQLEFARTFGVPVTVLGEEPASIYSDRQFDKGISGNYYIPDFKDLSYKMIDIYNNFYFYSEIAIKQSLIIREKYSWKKAAETANVNIRNLILNLKNVEFVKFINKNRGIEYKNTTNKIIHAKIKIFDTKQDVYVYESNITLEPDIIYYSTLNQEYKPEEELIFQIFDTSNNLILSIKKDFLDSKELKFKKIIHFNNKSIETISFDKESFTLHYKLDQGAKGSYRIKMIDENSNGVFYEQSIFLEKDTIYWSRCPYIKNYIHNNVKIIFEYQNLIVLDESFPIYIEPNHSFLSDLNFDKYEVSIGSYYEIFALDSYSKFGITVEPNDIVVDIGACVGAFVKLALDNKCKAIYCCEPNPFSINLIKKYYGNNNNLYINEYAISNTTGYADLLKQTSNEYPELSKLSEAQNIKCLNYNEYIKTVVKTITFKDFILINNLSKIDFLKVDCEGAEVYIFNEENIEYIKNNVRKIALEYHNDKIDDIIYILQKADFEIYKSPISDDLGMLYAKNRNINKIDVINESGSLGDAIAWVSIVNEFAIQKNQKINFYSPFKQLFEGAYPNLNFYNYWEKPISSNNSYSIGCFDIDDIKWNQLGLQEIASKILKIQHNEIRSKVVLPENLKNNFKRKYICIGSLSTSQAKFWNNPSGWTRVVDYLNSLGYDVVSIDKNNNIGCGEYVNHIPVNSIDKTGDLPLSDRINDLYFCEFFIGLGSGLSWLAWATGKPVVMISGFSDPKSEFYTPYRVINKNVCNSCWNDPDLSFDKGNWAWCPRNKNFECSREISFDMVKEKIDLCINDLKK